MAASAEPAPGPAPGTVPAPLLVLGAVVSVQTGQALGKGLFDAVGGPLGAVALRLGLAALLLLALWRPRLPTDRRSLLLVLALGTAIAGMNLSYLAMDHLQFGVAMTIQLSGPLAVALLTSRRWSNAAWGLLAAAGTALFALPGAGGQPLSPVGTAWAVASAISMGAYLLLSKRTSTTLSGSGPLALAVCWAAVLTLPFGLAQAGTRLAEPPTLLAGLGVALLSAAPPTPSNWRRCAASPPASWACSSPWSRSPPAARGSSCSANTSPRSSGWPSAASPSPRPERSSGTGPAGWTRKTRQGPMSSGVGPGLY